MVTTQPDRLTPEQVRRLDRLKHYATAYEVVCECVDRGVYLVCYTTKRSRVGLVKALQARADAVLTVTGLPDSAIWDLRDWRTLGLTCGPWRVRFSGRTHQECIRGRELQPIRLQSQELSQ